MQGDVISNHINIKFAVGGKIPQPGRGGGRSKACCGSECMVWEMDGFCTQ